MNDPQAILGFSIPLRVNARGGIATAEGAECIRLSVLTILGVHPGERLMRPDYGCPLRNLVFAPNDAATASLARYYVETAIKRWEPRVELTEVRVTNKGPMENGSFDGPCLLIAVRYRVLDIGREESLAFQLPLA